MFDLSEQEENQFKIFFLQHKKTWKETCRLLLEFQFDVTIDSLDFKQYVTLN